MPSPAGSEGAKPVRPVGDLIVRVATGADFENWFRLYEAVAAEGKWIGGESPTDRLAQGRSFDAHVANPEATSFVAEVDGSLVGALGVRINGGVADLGMMVDSSWRGRGIGSELLRECVRWARERGAHKVILEVWPHNAAARRLYEKHGFVEEGRFRRHYRRRNGELWDAIRMSLVLDERSPGSPFPGD